MMIVVIINSYSKSGTGLISHVTMSDRRNTSVIQATVRTYRKQHLWRLLLSADVHVCSVKYYFFSPKQRTLMLYLVDHPVFSVYLTDNSPPTVDVISFRQSTKLR